MAKKMNLNGVKDFLFNHGEKVALGTCGFLALFFGVTGLMDALNAGKSESGKAWTAEMDERHNDIMNSIKTSPVTKMSPDAQKLLDDKEYAWKDYQYTYQPQAYINVGESADTKRQNPRVLPIRSGPKTSHLDYVAALVYTYDRYPDRAFVKVLQPPGGGGDAPQPGAQPPRGKNMPAAGAADGTTHFLKAGDPRRMIIGHAVFPMKEQVLEFQRALKMASQKELFDAPREDLPSPIGFELAKIEVLPNGKDANKEPEMLLKWDGRKFIVAEKLNNFLKAAMFDVKAAAALEPYIYSGLTMPLPLRAFGDYPPVVLDGGIQSMFDEEGKDPAMAPKKGPGGERSKLALPGMQKPKEGGGAKQPMMLDKDGQKADVPYTVTGMSRKELQAGGPAEQALDKRLFEKIYSPFHVLGLFAPTEAAAGANAQQPPGPMRGGFGGGGAQAGRFFDAWGNGPGEVDANGKLIEGPAQPNIQPGGLKKPGGKGPNAGGPEAPAAPAFPNWERDAVVRFIDVDVEPGKSYRYGIRIFMKNPNKGKTDKVAFAALAQPEELPPSEWAFTETYTVPRDYHLYAIDQLLLEGKTLPAAEAKIKDATTFQIHQWTKAPVAPKDQRISYPIGDWVIAKRVLVHRGDPIGRGALVNVPYWDERADAFKLPTKKYPGASEPSLEIDMEPPIGDNAAGGGIVGDAGYPVLIDFIGGKRKPPNAVLDEDVAVDALIVGTDGKLRVLNSRDASDAVERQKRVQDSVERVNELSGTTGSGAQKKGPVMPGNNNN